MPLLFEHFFLSAYQLILTFVFHVTKAKFHNLHVQESVICPVLL